MQWCTALCSSSIQIKQFRDFIGLLPENVSMKILTHLKAPDLVRAMRVSQDLHYFLSILCKQIINYGNISLCFKVNKVWHRLCNKNSLWRSKCDEVELGTPNFILHVFLFGFPSHQTFSHVSDVPVYSKPGREPDWKQLYKENLSLRLNWQRGNCDIIDCKGHKDRCVLRIVNSTS